MPSLRPRLNCGVECPLSNYSLPEDGNERADIEHQSARAVAYAAGNEGQPSDNNGLNALAERCAQHIVSNECRQWVQPASGGFAFRTSKHLLNIRS